MESRILDALKDRTLELGPTPDTSDTYRNFKLTRDADGVAWLLFDRANASANTLSEEVLTEFDMVLTALEAQRPTGIVIRSAKPSGFIAGADINEFRGSDPVAIEAQIARAHAVVDRFEALKIPTVAVIHGFCLGGGLEIALACQMRIAIDGARFGFPEVMLGLHPGLGGTARFTHLVSPLQAMPMMLTGKTIDARKAKAIGLVDAVTEERHVRNAVKDAVFGRLKRAKPSPLIPLLNFSPVRGILASRMVAEASKQAPREHYPAPYALIDLWEKHGGDRPAMLKAEQRSFARLMVTTTAQNLIRVFFLREAMKKLAGAGDGGIKHVHVIGAGAMGGDIAAWCAHQGLRVTLADMKAEPLAGAIKRAADLYAKIVRKRTDQRDTLDRLIPDLDGEGVRNADLIIEAVPEKLDLKQKVYAGLEPRMKPDAILATNTSSIPLQDLRTSLTRPERLLGLHFFNPVSRLQLVEVVSHDGVDQEMLKRATAFVGAIDRLPLPVKSSPGFLVNRALTPYMLEAMMLLDEKVEKETIDAAAEQFGMPMGPIELADQVGLDICMAVGDMLRSKFGDLLPPTPAWLREKVNRGELGKKTGKGFYVWKDGKAEKSSAAAATARPSQEMIDRLVLPISNVCVACLREGIVDDADVVDGAMIFGTGYAPFRGGPLHYARSRGPDNVAATLRTLAAKYGDRFAPDEGWETFT
ncbi:3-hydroxyacyl-CoA dehydrogenase NAD-binding domain-containing protein [Tardiphaga alba]|nr:3-hydroxyacyl-CoA dehydrogenase NAD-binding domain-containing protein [Tardiphaga alba]